MLNFNNNHIFTSYIQELLNSVYLPTCLIYNANEPSLHSSKSKPILYYKDNELQYYNESGVWECADSSYYLDKKALNQSKKFIIKSNIYTGETHEYLGEYLRYLRDTQNIDLMSQYNCFSNTYCNNLNLNIDFSGGYTTSFNSTDTAYKIYMLPVKLFKNYTLAIDCSGLCEIACGFYPSYLYTPTNDAIKEKTTLNKFYQKTYKKYRNLKFNSPVVYTGLVEQLKSSLGDLETDLNLSALLTSLVMFIKVPSKNKSSIVVLEGDYQRFGDACYKNLSQTGYKKMVNNYTTNYDADYLNTVFRPITTLQLLQINDKKSHPFSDRLIEYLLRNVITSQIDEIPDNIKRAQAVMSKLAVFESKIPGVWEPTMQRLAYDYMMYYPVEWSTAGEELPASQRKPFMVNVNKDTLGYIDKDVEANYQIGKDSLANINIYEPEKLINN